ncbi:MAG: hypothetical protein AB1414_18640 [bacterium]
MMLPFVATLKDHGIEGLYTVNTADFEGFDWLTVINPLKDDKWVKLSSDLDYGI